MDTQDAGTKEVMALFENYLASNPQNKARNSFWNSEAQEKHANYDFLESEFRTCGEPYELSILQTKRLCKNDANPMYFKITILKVTYAFEYNSVLSRPLQKHLSSTL